MLVLESRHGRGQMRVGGQADPREGHVRRCTTEGVRAGWGRCGGRAGAKNLERDGKKRRTGGQPGKHGVQVVRSFALHSGQEGASNTMGGSREWGSGKWAGEEGGRKPGPGLARPKRQRRGLLRRSREVLGVPEREFSSVLPDTCS